MKNFLKLLNFELNRFIKLYVFLIGVIFVIQITGVIIAATRYIRMANNAVLQGGMSQLEFVETYSHFVITEALNTVWFVGPIAIGIAALIFHLFFIWYRDWFARNTFIYRLLMLPTSRMNIFFSKATTVMLTVLGLVACQLVFLIFYNNIVKWIIPKVYRIDLSISQITNGNEYLSMFAPQGLFEFIIVYGLGFSFVIIIFTAILMERSFKLTGAILGVIYIFVAVVLFLAPTIIQLLMMNKIYLYPGEIFTVHFIMLVIIVIISLFISRYLLKNKVTV